jgi:hypothetical protein
MKKVVRCLEIICHCDKAISYPRPKLMFVCNPSHVAGKMSVCHSVDPHTYFHFNIGEVSSVAPGRRVMYAQSLFRVCDLLLLNRACCAVRIGYQHFLRGCLGVHSLTFLTDIIKKIPKTFFWLQCSSRGVYQTAPMLQLQLSLTP